MNLKTKHSCVKRQINVENGVLKAFENGVYKGDISDRSKINVFLETGSVS
jgi:hypothetical protein